MEDAVSAPNRPVSFNGNGGLGTPKGLTTSGARAISSAGVMVPMAADAVSGTE